MFQKLQKFTKFFVTTPRVDSLEMRRLRQLRFGDFCDFPRRRCVCSHSIETDFLLAEDSVDQENGREVENEELAFYNDDCQTFQTVIVEDKLNTAGVIKLLAMRLSLSERDLSYFSIVDLWEEQNSERILEDHEYVLAVHNCNKTYVRSHPQARFRFYFRNEVDSRYELLENPEKYFKKDMMAFRLEEEDRINKYGTQGLLDVLLKDDYSPIVVSMVTVRMKNGVYKRSNMVLMWGTLFLINDALKTRRFITRLKMKNALDLAFERDKDVEVYCVLSEYHIYCCRNAVNQLQCPGPWGILLRPAVDDDTEEDTPKVGCFLCDSSAERTCWLSAMRLAKYGKQIRENYRSLKNKKSESSSNVKQDHLLYLRSEAAKSRVAMDFTGPVSRVIDDPHEAKAVAMSEGRLWKSRWKAPVRSSSSCSTSRHSDNGPHLVEPWFYSKITRDEATNLLNQPTVTDGMFLVRESQSNPQMFVLSYKLKGRVVHCRISRIPFQEDTETVSLDGGNTKFCNLSHLVEFYKLNQGCLPIRLTHHMPHHHNHNQPHPVASTSSS